ncbi:unnamed protein product [Lactuca saligna]|uniref:Uncharacterized protein n=1 Tax=Lactuca saligna TaxID=75948 RepID=A0AA35VSY7_LACSI|nr:unnamed protein product [Lactuca saligna]
MASQPCDLVTLEPTRVVETLKNLTTRFHDYRVVQVVNLLSTANDGTMMHLYRQFRFPSESHTITPDKSHGKAIMVVEDNEIEKHQGDFLDITMLLSLLNQPLYLRSIAHLEQSLNLLDVIIDYAESKQVPAPEESHVQISTTEKRERLFLSG